MTCQLKAATITAGSAPIYLAGAGGSYARK